MNFAQVAAMGGKGMDEVERMQKEIERLSHELREQIDENERLVNLLEVAQDAAITWMHQYEALRESNRKRRD